MARPALILLFVALNATCALADYCTGRYPCKECKDCSKCQLCSKNEGRCGVCKPRPSPSPAK